MTDTITIGPFVAGEIPAPLTYTFLDADGVAIDLTGYTARFEYQRLGDTAVERTAVIATGGKVTYQWVAADLATAGLYFAEVWVDNGANRFASPPIVYRARAAINTPTFS